MAAAPDDPTPPRRRLEPRVCYCLDVDEATIERAIRAGAHTVDAVRDATGASSGCGTCRFDVEEILTRVLGHPPADEDDD